MQEKNVEAIVLAGGKMDDSDMPKFAISLNGRSILGGIIEALRGSKYVKRIILVGDVDRSNPMFRGVDAFALPGDSMMTSLLSGMQELKNKKQRILGVCSDVPFLTSDGVDHCIERCAERPRAQVCHCVVEQMRYTQMFPDIRRTWATLRDAKFRKRRYCSTGLDMLSPSIVDKIVCRTTRLYHKRKNVLALAWELGLFEIFLYLLGLCSLGRVERTVSRLLDVYCVAIEVEDPRLAVNTDKQLDLQLVAKYDRLLRLN